VAKKVISRAYKPSKKKRKGVHSKNASKGQSGLKRLKGGGKLDGK